MGWMDSACRKLLARLTTAAIASLAAATGASAQTDDPIRIGMIYSKQGPGSSIGQFLERGSELAVEQAGGKVLGRKI